MRKPRRREIDIPPENATAEERYSYVIAAAGLTIDFYQSQTNKYSFWYIFLTSITLLGTALTPLFVILLKPDTNCSRFAIALPSAIAGLAAAANSAFKMRDEWAQNYFALSAIDNERDRLAARSAPEYSIDKTLAQIVDVFQNRVSEFLMSEVVLWRKGMAQSKEIEKGD